MNIKKTQFIVFLLGCALALVGCASETTEEAPVPESEEPAPAPEEVVEMQVAEEEIAVEAEEVVEEVVMQEEEPAEPLVVPREEPVDVEQELPSGFPADSGSYIYVIRHNDYLVKIANNEYGNPNEWRRIYNWNRERIGDDPNLIYPYHELELYKPVDEIISWDYDYTIHVAEQGETLWTIAGEEYGDEIAWIVIFWDNEEMLGSNGGRLKPGMELRIRTELWSGR
ncbi:MAG: hypothetical protein JSU77_07225 [Fidelibacterota bacterium]|nr:MAG: hypothetical protein JSU77_07225 [Candidatus Neomarinimicrobiota bacterium]